MGVANQKVIAQHRASSPGTLLRRHRRVGKDHPKAGQSAPEGASLHRIELGIEVSSYSVSQSPINPSGFGTMQIVECFV